MGLPRSPVGARDRDPTGHPAPDSRKQYLAEAIEDTSDNPEVVAQKKGELAVLADNVAKKLGESEKEEERAERLRLYYVAMTRAIDRLIVSGAIERESSADRSTPMGWVLEADGEIVGYIGNVPLSYDLGGRAVGLEAPWGSITWPRLRVELPV